MFGTSKLRPVAIAALLVGTGLASAVATGGCAGGGGGAAAAPSAKAARGDVVLAVGGVGQIVSAGAGSETVVPVAPGATTGPGSAIASSDTVFATAPGRIGRYLVASGARVRMGQAIAVVDDLGASSSALAQARDELGSARLELRLKQTADPSRGLPASPAELRAAEMAVGAAKRRLGLIGRPGQADRTTADLELRKAEAELASLLQSPSPVVVAAAERAVGVAYGRLAQARVTASATDVLAARQELARAQSELDALHEAPGAAAVEAANLAVTAARQRLAELPPGSPASVLTQARLDLATAQAALEALQRRPSAAAIAAAKAAVDLALARLSDVTGPPSALSIASARADLERARSELQAARARPSALSVEAGRLAVRVARKRLLELRRPSAISRDAAHVDLTRALADLEALRLRGGPAGPIELGLARAKVRAAERRVADIAAQRARLTVRAPRAGTVTGVLGAPGTPVDLSAPIAVVSDLARLAVEVELSEFDIARVRLGQTAIVAVDALGGRAFSGNVVFEASTGVRNGGIVTYPVRVGLPVIAGVKPGMSVSVRIVVAKRTGVIHVPLEAVARDGGDASVTVVDASGAESVRRVSLGLADNKTVEIRSGLVVGERVLLETGGRE